MKKPYSPISDVRQTGTVDFVVKIYRPNENTEYPAGGQLTPHIEKLQVGDKLEMAGPIGLLSYHGHGKIVVRGEEKNLKNLAFIAGGSGITPIYNVIQSSLINKDGANLSLLYANHTPADILLKSHLDALHAENPESFKLSYTVSRGYDDTWSGFTGRINKEMIAKSLPPPSSDLFIVVIGPKGFNDSAKEALVELGYTEEMYL